jgi:hypothetical protein
MMWIGSIWSTITSTAWIPVNTPRNRRNRGHLDLYQKVMVFVMDIMGYSRNWKINVHPGRATQQPAVVVPELARNSQPHEWESTTLPRFCNDRRAVLLSNCSQRRS